MHRRLYFACSLAALILLLSACELSTSLWRSRARLQYAAAQIAFQLGQLDSACNLIARYKIAMAKAGLKAPLSAQTAFFSARCTAQAGQIKTALSYLGLALDRGYPLVPQDLQRYAEFGALQAEPGLQALFQKKGLLKTAEDYARTAGAAAERLGVLFERGQTIVLGLLQILQRLGLALIGFSSLFLLSLFLVSFLPYQRGLFSFCTAFGFSLLAWLTVGYLAIGWEWNLFNAPTRFLLLLSCLLATLYGLSKLLSLLFRSMKRSLLRLWRRIVKPRRAQRASAGKVLSASARLRERLTRLENGLLNRMDEGGLKGALSDVDVERTELLEAGEKEWQALVVLLRSDPKAVNHSAGEGEHEEN